MKIKLKKFGVILNSRPAGRDAALAIKSYIAPDSHETIELDFSGVVSVGPSWLDEVLTLLRTDYGRERIVCLPTKNPSVVQSLAIIDRGQPAE
jgi:hypothetical protein